MSVRDFFVHFERQSGRAILVKAYLTVALVTAADYVLGERLSLFIMYFFPVLIVAWYVGRREGVMLASVCAFGVLFQDLSSVHSLAIRSPGDLIPYWDFLQRLALFVFFSIVVSSLRRWQEDKVEAEFRVAREVQQFMLPRAFPPMSTLSYGGVFRPATTLSGDFYDCIPLGGGRVAFVVGDVCGKGTPAALLMAYLHGVVRSNPSDDPAALMRTVNSSLHSSTGTDRFASMFYGVYDDATRVLTYVNAGHDAPIVLRGEADGGGCVLRLTTEGLLLGVSPGAVYEAKSVQLTRGDVLALYTDGVIDARNAEGRTFDEERLLSALRDGRRLGAAELALSVADAADAFTSGEPRFDDMTLVVAKVL